MAKFFKYPFAVAGDKSTIPELAQPDGSISYEMGYTSDYTQIYGTDPNAKAVARYTFNELMYDTTDALNQYQTHGVPDFITSADNGGTPYSYDIHSMVRYDPGSGVQVYRSLISSNTDLPTVIASWAQLTPANVIARVALSAPQSIPATLNNLVHLDTVAGDPQNLWTGSPTYGFTIPRTGWYALYSLISATAFTSTGDWSLDIYINTVKTYILESEVAVNGQKGSLAGYIEVFLNASDLIQLRIANACTSSIPIGNSVAENYFGLSYRSS